MPEPLGPNSTTLSSGTKSLAVSSRARRGICFSSVGGTILCLAALFLSGLLNEAGSAAKEPSRPRILGIAGVGIVAPSELEAGAFYRKVLGLNLQSIDCAGVCMSSFEVNPQQRILLVNREPSDSNFKPMHNHLLQVTFETSDTRELHSYLESRGIHTTEVYSSGLAGSDQHFWVADPEGHQIGFVQFTGREPYSRGQNQVSTHLIHAGFVVHDRAAMDKFYKDILGFHVYWHGGMKEGVDNWVDMQVPDGTDWIEYMLNVPADANKHTLGVMNHIALGVPDIHAAAKQLLTNGMKLTEEPKIGRDGKWQLNLYDPDDTRVELMEFTPVQKPCCSEYTGPHPKP
jgi:catechol 2,3-dioxygenase-like lactoylglutathione lyase family enzyme